MRRPWVPGGRRRRCRERSPPRGCEDGGAYAHHTPSCRSGPASTGAGMAFAPSSLAGPAGTSAGAANVAGVGVARRSLELPVRLPPLGQEHTLVDLMVDEVPRKQLVRVVRAMH